MIWRLFGRSKGPEQGAVLYSSVVAAARQPWLYTEGGVPDTVDGRLEALMLVTGLAVDRLTREKDDARRGEAREMARQLSEAFFDDMDRTLREAGITDIGVPKKVRKVARNFYGRLTVYVDALHDPDPQALEEALRRNVFANMPGSDRPLPALARAVRTFYQDLCGTPLDGLAAGRLEAGAALAGRGGDGNAPDAARADEAAAVSGKEKAG